MTYRGRVQNGVIVLDPPAALPEGTPVEVAELGCTPEEPTLAEALRDFIGKAEGLPSDSSLNHDHYLYGLSKK